MVTKLSRMLKEPEAFFEEVRDEGDASH